VVQNYQTMRAGSRDPLGQSGADTPARACNQNVSAKFHRTLSNTGRRIYKGYPRQSALRKRKMRHATLRE